jgi:hypothetical protein
LGVRESAMALLATCLSIGAVLASAKGGEQIRLTGRCASIQIDRQYGAPISIDASGALVRGLTIKGGNIRWSGGTIEAPEGPYAGGPNGYAVNLMRGAANISFDNVLFTNANRGIRADGINGLSVTNSRFLELGSDGIIASASSNLLIAGNRFADTKARPTQCATVDGVQLGLSRRACVAEGGTWKDGDHPDAVQLRHGVKDARLAKNVVEGRTQGLSQMAGRGDDPLERIVIEDNVIITDFPHKASLSACTDCVVRRNTARRPKGSKWKAYFSSGPAFRCGNIEDDPLQRDRKC